MDAELEKEEQARANISRILNELIDGYDNTLRPNIRGKLTARPRNYTGKRRCCFLSCELIAIARMQ